MESDLDILTPEKTVVTYRLASFGARFGAHLIDWGAIIGIGLVAAMISTYVQTFLGDSAVAPLLVFFAALPFLYFIVLEGLWNGKTLGKAVFSIRVRLADGTPVSFFAATIRNFLRPADMLPPVTYLVGSAAMFLNPRLQRIGDLVANTVVVYEPKTLPAVSLAPHQVGLHPLEHLIGDLRRMREPEYWALRRYCDRYPFLPAPVQERLTERLWLPMAARLAIPMRSDIHPIFLAEATVMKFGRERGLL